MSKRLTESTIKCNIKDKLCVSPPPKKILGIRGGRKTYTVGKVENQSSTLLLLK